jgi:hypothetical protein
MFIFFYFFKKKISIQVKYGFINYLYMVNDFIHNPLNKARFNIFFENIFFLKHNYSIFSSNFQKNEYYVYSDNLNNLVKYNYFINYSSMLDIVSYDCSGIKYLFSMGNFSYIRLYVHNTDTYLNIFIKNFYNINLYNNFNWHLRECLEFFEFKNNLPYYFDNRNLLTNYSNRDFYLNKNVSVSGLSDYKNKSNKFKVLKKKQVIL